MIHMFFSNISLICDWGRRSDWVLIWMVQLSGLVELKEASAAGTAAWSAGIAATGLHPHSWSYNPCSGWNQVLLDG